MKLFQNRAFIFFSLLVLPGCKWFGTGAHRETIFDRVVSIPKELVFDIPQLPPLCDEIPDLKKGFISIPNPNVKTISSSLDEGRCELYFEEEGQGIPLVLINGGPGGTHHGFHPYFSQINDLACIIYYDQRGTGKSSSDKTGKTYTIKQAVEDLEAIREALDIDKWAVLGWSYGGLLAQCYALTYPEHVIGLILVAAQSGISESIKFERALMFIALAEQAAMENKQSKRRGYD